MRQSKAGNGPRVAGATDLSSHYMLSPNLTVPSAEERTALGRALVDARNRGDKETTQRIVNDLIERNLPLVMNIAHRYESVSGVEFADLVNYGALGLHRALQKWDPDKGALSTYAKLAISRGIERSLTEEAHLVRVPAHVARHTGRIAELKAADSELSTAEIAKRFQISPELCAGLLSVRAPMTSVEMSRDTVESSAVGGVLPQSENPLVRDLRLALAELPQQQRMVIQKRFGLNDEGRAMEVSEVAALLGMSEQDVKAAEQAGKRQLAKVVRRAVAA